MRDVRWLPIALLLGTAAPATAQLINPARLAILEAEDRRAAAPGDLARLQAAARGADPMTARVAVRALGRLERPPVIADLLPALTHIDPEVRAEAANAVAQAAAGARRGATGGPPPAVLLQTIRARLAQEEVGTVRAVLAESLARLPYADTDSPVVVQQVLGEMAAAHGDTADRLGVAKAFEAFVRLNRSATLTPASIDLLRRLVGVVPAAAAEPLSGAPSTRAQTPIEPPRDARVRRLALEALATAEAVDADVLEHARRDADPQLRRLAVRAAGRGRHTSIVTASLEDPSSQVRLEAVRALAASTGDDACAWMLAATADGDIHVVLQAIDGLRACGHWDQAATRLADFAADTAALAEPRGWHRGAHALVALAAGAPTRAAALLPVHAQARNPFVRVYAARAARVLRDRATLERMAADRDDNVVEEAVEALSEIAGRGASAVFRAALTRSGYQVVRAAARALAVDEASPDTQAALRAALDRLVAEGHANSTDARAAIEHTLTALGAAQNRRGGPAARMVAPTLEELRRLAAPRARIAVRGVGTIDVALITAEAPLTVVHMARLAERGYFNGLTIHRVAPNFVLQGGSPGANEYVGHPDHMRDEVGQWPHVRGALGISTRGRDTGDAQFFVDLVDNPRLDHEYTVFGQVLTGMDVADRVLEGDVIESVQILAK